MSIEDDYQATVARCVELEEMNAKLRASQFTLSDNAHDAMVRPYREMLEKNEAVRLKLQASVDALCQAREDQMQALGLPDDDHTVIADEIRRLRDEGRGYFHDLTKAQERMAEQLAVLKTCAGLAARLEKAEDTILALQEIAWSRIKLGGTAYTNAAVSRFQQMSNRLEAHRDLMEKKLAADDLAQKLNGSHEG